MPSESKFTTDSQGNVAIRVVNQTEALPASDPNWMFARDTNGNIAIRVVGEGGGGGGSDVHNLGWYATPTALRTAHATAENGDFAIVGSTDTVWVWDEDSTDWIDSGAKPSSTYAEFPAGWTTNSTTKAFCDAVAADSSAIKGMAYLGGVTFSDLPENIANAEIVVEIMSGTTASDKVIVLTCTSGNKAPYMWKYTYWNGGSNVSGWIGFQPELPSQTGNSGKFLTTNGSTLSWASVQFIQVDTMPIASTTIEGKIVQYIGVTDANYTNGYFYKCVSDGGNPATYSWIRVDVQPAPSGLPDQTGQSGKFLTTDGTDASWSNKPLVNKSTNAESIVISSVNSGLSTTSRGIVALGFGSEPKKQWDIMIGYGASTGTSGTDRIGIGHNAYVDADGAIQIGAGNNFNANSFQVRGFLLLDANGIIPADRLASTTGLADGNYRLRLTISSGVATLSCVAE